MPIRTTLAAALAAASMSTVALAQPVTDSFLYQGELLDNGAPASGLYDMEFRVYTDAVAGVVPPGAMTSVNNVEVTDGLFSVEVDFGVSGFVFDTDDARWLEIRVSEAGVPGITILAPRQKLVPAPLANYALRSGFAQQSSTSLGDAYFNGSIIDAQLGPVSVRNTLGFSAELELGTPISGNGTGELVMYTNSGNPTFFITGDNGGGSALTMGDSDGSIFSRLEPDFEGDAGFFTVFRDIGTAGFSVDGSHNNSNSTRVSITGNSSMALDASETGDDSVEFPVGSISNVEILDEPGVAETEESLGSFPNPLVSGAQIMSSVSINTPDFGYVLVIATAEASVTHTQGASSGCNFGIANGSTDIPSNGDVELRLSSVLPTGTYDFPVTVQAIFPASEGMRTFNFLADPTTTNAEFALYDKQISAVYLPTAYGSVAREPGDNQGPNLPDELTPMTAPWTQLDIVASENAALRADTERQERELEEMRQRMERMEQHLNNGRE